MARRTYRVVKRLPWIEGGSPARGFQWEGGKTVVYEPGESVTVDDQELQSIFHHLEALDDAGRIALEAVRAKAEEPARITAVANLHPRTVEWLTRALDEKLRAEGRLRKLVLRMLARDDDPTADDLAAALEESPDEPLPRELHDYLVRVLRGHVARKPGRKAPPRTTDEELVIQSVYSLEVEDLKARFASQKRPKIQQMAAETVADMFGLSVRTVQRIVSPRPWTKTPKP